MLPDNMIDLADVDAAPSLPMPSALHPAEILRAARERREVPATTMDLADRLVEVVQDPERMHEVVEGMADPFDDHAPNLANDLRLATVNALTFLASKAPRRLQTAPGLEPLDPPASEVRKFERYMNAVNDPTSLMDDVLRGDVTAEAIEAVRTVYPQIFQMMQAQVAERINQARDLPYKRRMQISMLLGQDMTGTRNPRMGMMAQAVYGTQPPPQKQQQMPVSRAKGLRVAERSAEYDTNARYNAQLGARRGYGP